MNVSTTNNQQPTTNKMMTAAVLYGKKDVRVERVVVGTLEAGEVRVRIGAALTCGTDVKVYRRGNHARMIRPPAVFGHEMAGTIIEVAPDVEGWQIGERVVIANSAPCGMCYYCRRDLTELCEDLLFLNGAYAQSITVPARVVQKNLYRLPDHVAFDAGALTEPLACVVRGMDEMPVQRGETVIVLGLGPIGLLFVRLCKLAGARVLAVGRRAERLALASTLGADEVFDEKELRDVVGTLQAHTEAGQGADKVIEAVGLPSAWETAIALSRKAGTVSLFGGCPADTQITVATHRIHYDELTLKGTFSHTPDTFRRALALIVSGDLDARPFIQAQAPLADLPAVLASLADGTNGAIKTAIIPPGEA